METLESSRVCRLCGQQSGISINIFDEKENHVRKINAMLPIMVHEMDLLPKQMCHRCSYKLEEFHKFYIGCLKTDAALKSQLSWMRKDRDKERVGVPMVHIENMKIKTEPLADYDVYELEPLVENIEYINSMAFPAGGIHNGHTLTYTAFPRCQCYCDKKDQSKPQKSAAQLRRDYEESKQGRMTNDLRKKSLVSQEPKPGVRSREPIKRKAEFLDCPRSYQSRVIENAHDRLTTTDTRNNVSSLGIQSRSRLDEAVSGSQTVSTSATVRNLRPRKNLDFLSGKKKTVSDKPRSSVATKPRTLKSKMMIAASDFEPTRQIKVEPMDEYKGRNLRPRRNVVDYKESRPDRVKRRKVDDTEQESKLRLKKENASDTPKVTIKREVPDSEDIVSSSETFKVTTPSRNKYRDITPLTPRIKLSNNLRNAVMDYLKLVEQKTLSNIVQDKLVKTKKTNRFTATNCTSKNLRSQNTYLRNGKVRGVNYMEWSEKKLQTKRLMEVVNNDVKKIRESTMLKLAESIKHYCEKCNVTFLNKEVFNLHACYY